MSANAHLERGQALIDPSTPAENGGLDNENFELILYENSQIKDPAEQIYTVIGKLGEGRWGQVYEVSTPNPSGGDPLIYAMKISKSTEDSLGQFHYETQALAYIKANSTEEDLQYVSDVHAYFQYKGHICIVLDKCGPSTLSFLQSLQFSGLPLSLVQQVLRDVLTALKNLANLSIIHCDVKPENICALDDTSAHVKLIDFGSCAVENTIQNTYTQSRYYRAPEVALHLDYDTKADIWSTGCVAAELMLGLPLFPAESERHLICLIAQMLGPYPQNMREETERHDELFMPDETLKSPEILCAENNEDFINFQSYFVQEHLDDIIMNYIYQDNLTDEEIEHEKENRRVFIDLLEKMLQIDPALRISAEVALEHPFLSLPL